MLTQTTDAQSSRTLIPSQTCAEQILSVNVSWAASAPRSHPLIQSHTH